MGESYNLQSFCLYNLIFLLPELILYAMFSHKFSSLFFSCCYYAVFMYVVYIFIFFFLYLMVNKAEYNNFVYGSPGRKTDESPVV